MAEEVKVSGAPPPSIASSSSRQLAEEPLGGTTSKAQQVEMQSSSSSSTAEEEVTTNSSSTPPGHKEAATAAAVVGEPAGLVEARRLLKDLYEIHDFFFTADKAEKKELLKEGCAKVMAQLDRFGEGSSTRERAKVSFLRGRALDVFETFDRDAEAALSKAVKLEPSDIEAWNGLGHCFWKKGDLQGAVGCYKEALHKRVNKDSLRQLSMVMRQLPAKTIADAQKHVQESLKRAKEAVKLDVRDPESWYVLGNAYTTMFFKVTHALADLDRALQAYQQAEANGGENNPDLYYNQANVLRFKEDVSLAAEAFRKATDLDPSLRGADELDSLQQRARRTIDLLDKKGRVKAKRLSALVSGLDKVTSPDADKYTLVEGIHQLSVGANEGKAVALKLVIPVGQLNHPPNSFIVADKSCRCAVLSIYHIDQEACHRFGEKDVFIVLQPFLKKVHCPADIISATATDNNNSINNNQRPLPTAESAQEGEEGGEEGSSPSPQKQQQTATDQQPDSPTTAGRSYESIQILEPTSLLINGKVINSAHVSPAVIRLDNFDG